ncbi:MAG: glycosyltransferase [Kiritimatiellia bacterium]
MYTPPPSFKSDPAWKPDARPHVAVILPVFNGLSFTQACVESLRTHTPDSLYTLWVVDNGSTDGTREWLQEQEGIRVLCNEENLGYVQANNLAMRQIPPDQDVLLLNNDTEILHSGWLERLRAIANGEEDVGIVGCRLVNREGIIQHAGTYMPTHTWQGFQLGSGQEDIGQFHGVTEVEGVIGASMYIRRDLRAAIGLLHEGYVSYYEDVDYCFKCGEMGYRVLCDLDTRILHHENVSSKINNLDLNGLIHRSMDVFVKRWKEKIEQSYRLPLLWHSLTSQPGGYSRSSREIMIALDREGIDVRFGCLFGTKFHEPETGDVRVDQLKQRSMDLNLPQVVYGQGDLFYKNGGAYRIGYTMLETDGLPQEWVQQCNMMDEIWVPSEFNRKTFQQSGVTRPIHLVPLGVDPMMYHPELQAERFSERYTFLSVFEWGERKAPEALLRAFCKAFGPEDDVALVIKYSIGIPFDLRKFVFDLGLPEKTPPIVFLQSSSVAHEQMGALYRGADCFVLATHGEGWGMPIMEAMACGLPAVATNWSGQTMFMTEENSYPVRVKSLVPAVARCPYYEGFRWAEIDEDHLAETLRHIYLHPEEAKVRGARAAREVREKWTWKNSARAVIERLEAIGGMTCRSSF